MTSIEDAATKLAEALDSRIFVYSGPIDQPSFGDLMRAMQPSDSQPHRPNSLLFLTTQGGLANSAYQIARLFQTTSEKFSLCIPAKCKSAGTLIALGANDLIMSPVSELGPLDVQLIQRDEIGRRRSGLVVRTAFDGLAHETFHVFERIMLGIKMRSGQAVSFETASRIAATITGGVMAPVYAQISPDTLGNDLRDLHVATEYGDRLAEHGRNAAPNCVAQLVSGYPAHDFIIDKAEAEMLFRRVSEPTPEMMDLMSALGDVLFSEQSPSVIKRLDCVSTGKKGDDDTEGKAPRGSPKVASGRRAKGKGDQGGKPKDGGDPKPPEADEGGKDG